MTCTALVAVGLVVMAIAAVAMGRLPPKPKSRKVAIGVVLVLATLTFNVGVVLSVTASRAGFPTLYDTTIAQIAQAIRSDKDSTRLSDPTVSQALHALSYGIEDSSPMCLTEPILPEHTVAVLFRYDCSDCTATLNDLKAWANKTNVRVMFVSSRMPGGKRLAEAAHVTEVPSVVCVNPSTGEFVWRVAYKTVNGSSRIDESNLETITKIATNRHEV